MTEEIFSWEVFEHLRYDEPITKKQLAYILGCSPQTVANRIKELKRNYTIIHSLEGYMLVNKKSIKESMRAAKNMQFYAKWINGVLKGMARNAAPLNDLLPDMKKKLSIQLDEHEQDLLLDLCSEVIAYIAFSKAKGE